MNRERILSTFMDLVAIPSPSKHEALTAQYCSRVLEQLGFKLNFDQSQASTGSDTPQIIAQRPASNGGSGAIALSAHMDCVNPCQNISAHVDDQGVIRSDGTTVLGADDRSGLASIFEAVRSAIEREVPLPHITVLLSVCEELSVAGAPYFPTPLFAEPTLCLVLDAEGPAGTITTAAPFHYVFTATFKGRAAHAGVSPEEGLNAIAIASDAIAHMALGRLDEQTTANVGMVEGGSATNIVPNKCTIRGECRSLDGKRVEEVRKALEEACTQAAKSAGGEVDVAWELSYPGINIPQDDTDVQMLIQVADKLGLQPNLVTTGGGSDANVLGTKEAKAIPLGTGMTDFHTCHESLRVDDLCNCALFVEETLVAMGKATG